MSFSYFTLKDHEEGKHGVKASRFPFIAAILLRLAKTKVKNEEGEEVEVVPNFTLICLVLRIFGNMHEKTLCNVLLLLQLVTSTVVFYARYVIFKFERPPLSSHFLTDSSF